MNTLIVFLANGLKKCLAYKHDWITLNYSIQLLFAIKKMNFHERNPEAERHLTPNFWNCGF